MARILAYTSPARGHLFPLVPILDELGRRGHQVALRTLASQVPSMRARGFDAAPISDRDRGDRPRRLARHATRGRRWPARSRIFAQRAEHDAADLSPGDRPGAAGRAAGRHQRLGRRWPPPRRGAARGRRSAPTRCRSARGTCHRSGPGCRRPAARSGGCATGCCARSCSAPLERTMAPPINRVRASSGWRRSTAPTTSSAARRCCST